MRRLFLTTLFTILISILFSLDFNHDYNPSDRYIYCAAICSAEEALYISQIKEMPLHGFTLEESKTRFLNSLKQKYNPDNFSCFENYCRCFSNMDYSPLTNTRQELQKIPYKVVEFNLN